MKRNLLLVLGLSALFGAGLGAGLASGRSEHALAPNEAYTVTVLDTVAGRSSFGIDVNLSGEAVGTIQLSPSVFHAFVYTPGTGLTDLGTLGGTYSFANAINSSGLVTGYAQVAGGGGFHAFLYTPGVGMKDLGIGGPTGQSFGLDVSDDGQVTGQLVPSGHMFVWTAAGGLKDEGPGSGNAFNATDTIFGASGGVPGSWSPPYTTFSPFGAPPPSFTGGHANGGNIFGQAVGDFFNQTQQQGFEFSPGQGYTTTLPVDFSDGNPTAINDASGFLLNAFNGETGPTTPFLFTLTVGGGPPVNGNTLNPAGSPFSTFFEFNGIDDLGQIAGAGQAGTLTRAFILTPPPSLQVTTVGDILLHDLPASSPFYAYIQKMRELRITNGSTSCYELGAFGDSFTVTTGVPYSAAQSDVSRNALSALHGQLSCPSSSVPTVPVTVPHIFTRPAEGQLGLVKVGPGTLVLQTTFPSGSSFDIPSSSVTETSGKQPSSSVRLKLTKTKGKTFVRVKVSGLKRGTLHFRVVAKKLLKGKPTPVTTKVS